MRLKKAWRWVCALSLAGLMAGALAWFGPFAQSQERQPVCSLAADPLQPDQPLELNQVVKGDFLKTLAMEKEVFVCRSDRDQDGVPDSDRIIQVRDVETFIEIVDKKVQKTKSSPEGFNTVQRSISVLACTKDFEAADVICSTSGPDTSISRLGGELRECQPHPDPALQPHDPVEMETASLGSTLVRTIKVEKEVLDCGGRVADMYLFTSISERKDRKTIRQSARAFYGIICFKENPPDRLGNVDTNACLEFQPPIVGA
jgi:hypothetical protein